MRDPSELARFRNVHCKFNEAGPARALCGNWRPEHLFELKKVLEPWENLRGLIRECDREIDA